MNENYLEIIKGLEGNRYHGHKNEVAEICVRDKCDTSVACAKFRQEKGWDTQEPVGPDKESTAFVQALAQMTGEQVKAYFYGE